MCFGGFVIDGREVLKISYTTMVSVAGRVIYAKLFCLLGSYLTQSHSRECIKCIVFDKCDRFHNVECLRLL
jgi:hypothetical protein